MKSLALLVGGLLCGIGISVHEYLQSSRPSVRASTSFPSEPGTCRRDVGGSPCLAPVPVGELPRATSSEVRDAEPAAVRRPTTSVQSSAPTQWNPDEGSARDVHEDSTPDGGFGRSEKVSTQ